MQPTSASNTSIQTSEKNSDDLIFNEVKGRLLDLRQTNNSLDTKAAVALSFTGAIVASLVNAGWFLKLNFIYHILVLGGFGAAALLALAVVLTRRFRQDPDPKGLITLYANKSERETKGQLILNFSDCYTHNAKIVASKAFILKTALMVLVLSLVVLSVALLFTSHSVTIKY